MSSESAGGPCGSRPTPPSWSPTTTPRSACPDSAVFLTPTDRPQREATSTAITRKQMSGMRKASDEHELAGPRAEIDPGSRSNAARFASWAGVSTAVLAVASMVTGVTTPPRSGPYCEAGCVAYPYTAAAEFVPRDYLWMYPTLLMVLAFVTLAGGLHDLVP